jgi:hypothetical protein
VGITDFRSEWTKKKEEAAAERATGQDVTSFAYSDDGGLQEISAHQHVGKRQKSPEYKPDSLNMYWCYDTPGVVNPEQVHQQ